HTHTSSIFVFCSHVHHRDLHSFPTRRSSDLERIDEVEHAVRSAHPVLDVDQHGAARRGRIVDVHREHVDARLPLYQGLRGSRARSEEHTSELQSLAYLVCRLLLEKKKKNTQW